MGAVLSAVLPEVLAWIPFFAGQCLFMLKRMGLAVRSPLNAVKSRRQYLYQNWDILLVRAALEFVVVYFPYRHTSLFASYLPKWFLIIPASWVVTLAVGYMSDSLMDWIASQDKILGVPVPSFIKETIPQLPAVQMLVATLQEAKDTAIKQDNGK